MANELDAAVGSTKAPSGHASTGDSLDSYVQAQTPKRAPAPTATAKPIARPTTPFADPAKKPLFDVSGMDRAAVEQGQRIGGAITGGLSALAAGGGSVSDMLQAAPRATREKLFHGGSDDENMKRLRTKVGVEGLYERPPKSGPGWGMVNQLGKGLIDFGLGSATDPQIALQVPVRGLTLPAQLIRAGEKYGMTGAVKAGDALAKVPGVGLIPKGVAKVHDVMGVHSAAKRELARLHGPEWLQRYADYRADVMVHGGAPPAPDLAAEIRTHLAEIPEGPMRDSYVKALQRAELGHPFAQEISSPLRSHTAQVPTGQLKQPLFPQLPEEQLVEQSAFPWGPHEAPKMDPLAQPGPTIAADVRRRPPPPRREPPPMRPMKRAKITAEDMKNRVMVNGKMMWPDPETGELLPMPPRFVPERPIAVEPQPRNAPSDVSQGPATVGGRDFRHTFTHEAGLPKAVGARAPFRNVPPALKVPEIPKAVAPEPIVPPKPEVLAEIERTKRQPVAGPTAERLVEMSKTVGKRLSDEVVPDPIYGLMKRPGGLPLGPLSRFSKNISDVVVGGMFAPPFGTIGHEANVSALGAIAAPASVAKAIGRGVVDTAKQGGQLIPGLKKVLPKPESIKSVEGRHAAGALAGATSKHISGEEGDAFTTLLDKLAGKVGPAGPLVRGYKKAYEGSNESLWKFENEARTNRFNGLVAEGMRPNDAALKVATEFIDYGNKSPLIAALPSYVAPFANWGAQFPMAVGRSIIENPGNAAAIDRASPMFFGGSQGTDPESGRPIVSRLPPAEVGRAVTGGLKEAKRYAQAHFLGGTPARIAGNVAYGLVSKPPNTSKPMSARKRAVLDRSQYPFTYGVPTTTYALNETPGIGKLLELTGNGMFSKGEPPTPLSELLKLIRVGP